MKWLFFVVAVSFPALFFAQNESVIGNFIGSELNGKVLLTWTVKAGNTCNGIQVLRGTDSLNFVPIGSIEGICGSIQENVPYEFTDVSPEKNALNYYRLLLGGVGYSKIISVDIVDISENNYLLRPNPIVDTSELHFKNDAANEIVIRVYNEMGSEVKKYITLEEMILLDRRDYQKGIFFFIIYDQARSATVKGRFVIP